MTLYIISLGPGNPELITIQALKALEECEVIFIPVRSKNLEWKGSVAYKILQNISAAAYTEWFKEEGNYFNFIKEWEKKFIPIYTPMNYDQDSWENQADEIINAYNSHSKTGFVTLGDAGIYSSAYYLLDIIAKKYPLIKDNTKVIPGISSISYASAIIKKPLCLGNSRLEIIPAHAEEIKSTKVYMRLHKGDDVSNLRSDDLYYFENLGLENESYNKGTPCIIKNYLTILIDFASKSISNKEKRK